MPKVRRPSKSTGIASKETIKVGYWKDIKNQRKFFDELAKKLKVEKPEDWSQVRNITVLKEGGHFVNRYYSGSVARALQASYPEHKLNLKPPRALPYGYWRKVENQRAYFDQLATKLNIKKLEDWLQYRSETIIRQGAWFIAEYYQRSLLRALKASYPEHKWPEGRIRKAFGYWRDITNQRMFMDQMAIKLNIQKPEDWYNVHSKTLSEAGGTFLRYYYGTTVKALQAIYPERTWINYNPFLFGHIAEHRGSKSQAALLSTVRALLPGVSLLSNFRYPLDKTEIPSENRLQCYEFDIFVPSLSLAFEYQGQTHYISTHIFGSAAKRQQADKLKKDFAIKKGITLIPVPFWWDNSQSSLGATIRSHRPDVALNIPSEASPISIEFPKSQLPLKYKPNCPKPYNESLDPTGWLIMEMYDGVRVYWDGEKLRSADLTATIDVPKELNFPSISFEGELSMGFNNYQKSAQFLYASNSNTSWEDVKLYVFDAPQAMDKPYAERLNQLRKSIPKDHPVLSIVTPIRCESKQHFDSFFRQLCESNAKGVVLRNPSAWYYQKNSFYTKKVLDDSIVMKLDSGKWMWPTGSTVSLHMPYTKSAFCVVRYPAGLPEQAQFVSDVYTKQDLLRKYFHYHVDRTSRSSKQCRSCNQRLEANTLFIQTGVIHNSVHVNAAFCLNNSCLTTWLQHTANQAKVYAPFSNLLWVDSKDVTQVKIALPWRVEVMPSL